MPKFPCMLSVILWITCFLSFLLFLSLSLPLSVSDTHRSHVLLLTYPIFFQGHTHHAKGLVEKKFHCHPLIWHQPIPKIIPVLALILDHQSKHLISFWWISSLNTWVLFLLFDLSWGPSESSKLSNIEHQKENSLALNQISQRKALCLQCKFSIL